MSEIVSPVYRDKLGRRVYVRQGVLLSFPCQVVRENRDGTLQGVSNVHNKQFCIRDLRRRAERYGWKQEAPECAE